jgi:hypothetical protein
MADDVRMDRGHALQHVRDLRARVRVLRPMRPESPAYKLWLGDVVELANAVWGVGAPEVERIAAALRSKPPAEVLADPGRAYLRRLDLLDSVLAEYERVLGGSVG